MIMLLASCHTVACNRLLSASPVASVDMVSRLSDSGRLHDVDEGSRTWSTANLIIICVHVDRVPPIIDPIIRSTRKFELKNVSVQD